MINVAIVLAILTAAIVIVAMRNADKPKPSELVKVKCGCGKTQDLDNYCDGSHNNVDDNKVV